jgi:aryl-alcohol dehydrogenase-like predicted oxidoreductase
MALIRIPGTELSVSPICLGCANLGVKNTESEAFELLDAYVAAGGNFLDTARVYSNWVPGELNRSERIIRDWLESRKNRDRIVLATKGAHPILGSIDSRLSKDHIDADLYGSLETLRVDTIDLYYLHRDEPSRPVAEIIDVLVGHRDAGAIRAFACSNWQPDRIAAANAYAKANGVTGFVANQMRWSLAGMSAPAPEDKTMCAMDTSTYKLHIDSGLPAGEAPLAAIPYGSQGGGYFSKLAADAEAASKSGFHNDTNVVLLPLLQEAAADLDTSVAAVALAWLIAQPFPTIPIIGSRTIPQLEDSLKAADIALQDRYLARINDAVGF